MSGRYFSFDGDVDWMFHGTAAAARDSAIQALSEAQDIADEDGWPSWADSICWGTVSERVTLANTPTYSERAAYELSALPDERTDEAVFGEAARRGRLYLSVSAPDPLLRVLAEVAQERGHQDEKWGQQDHPDALPGVDCRAELKLLTASKARDYVERLARNDEVYWFAILNEEICEAMEADNPDRLDLRAELVQIAAVAVAWIEAIDRRTPMGAPLAAAPGARSAEGSIPSPPCPACGSLLVKISYPSNSGLNLDQWSSIRAGDWLCTKCPGHGNAGAYYWNRELGVAP